MIFANRSLKYVHEKTPPSVPSADSSNPSSLGNLPRQADPKSSPAAESGRAGLFAAVGELPGLNPDDWVVVRRGFGKVNLWELAEDEYVTASGLRDGGYVVLKRKVKP